jgi:hypothetical protein
MTTICMFEPITNGPKLAPFPSGDQQGEHVDHFGDDANAPALIRAPDVLIRRDQIGVHRTTGLPDKSIGQTNRESRPTEAVASNREILEGKLSAMSLPLRLRGIDLA